MSVHIQALLARRFCLAVVLPLWGLLWLTGCHSGAWSPDSKSIALDVDGKLCLFNIATGQFRTFNSGGRYVVNPTYSPEGKTLAYYAATRGHGGMIWHIWLRDLATNKERMLSSYRMNSTSALGAILTIKAYLSLAWSPDAHQLAYTRLENDGSWIELLNLTNGHKVSLKQKEQKQRFPLWSPDGKKLAYMVDTNPHALGHEISPLDLYVASADGRQPKKLWDSSKRPMLWPFDAPTWAADSTGITVFTMRPEDKDKYRQWNSAIPQQACFIPVDGTPSKVLTVLHTSLGTIAPSLKSVVYLGGQNTISLVYRSVPFEHPRILDTLVAQELPSTPQSSSVTSFLPPYPVLSPDGKTVALLPLINPKTRRYELRLYNLDTGKKDVYSIP